MSVDELHYALLTDGATDKALIPILTWLLHQHLPRRAVQARWADLRRIPRLGKKLPERIQATVALYPCDLIFVHRDAERESLLKRKVEVDDAVRCARNVTEIPPAIAVIPMRMTETWLLLDKRAIREAAGNPNGSIVLNLPRLGELENLPDPKTVLHNLILDATELSVRRKRRFDVSNAAQRIPEYIDDFSPLRGLQAFSALEEDVIETLREYRWND